MGLFDALFRKNREVTENKPTIQNKLESESLPPQSYGMREDYDPFSDPVRLALNNPIIIPCASDRTIEFWLARLEFWGKVNVFYTGFDGRKKRITFKEFEDVMLEDDEITRILGPWDTKLKTYKSFEMSRQRVDPITGKLKKETYSVNIDLHKDLEDAFNGKF